MQIPCLGLIKLSFKFFYKRIFAKGKGKVFKGVIRGIASLIVVGLSHSSLASFSFARRTLLITGRRLRTKRNTAKIRRSCISDMLYRTFSSTSLSCYFLSLWYSAAGSQDFGEAYTLMQAIDLVAAHDNGPQSRCDMHICVGFVVSCTTCDSSFTYTK